MKIILATKNKGKIKDFEKLTDKMDIEVLSILDNIDFPDVVEDGKTFEENSAKKALEITKYTGIITVSDDSGLCVDALNGEPGIYSARYTGEECDYKKNQDLLLKNLNGIKDRNAHFETCIALVLPDGKEFTATGRTDGYILEEPIGTNGFGYDPVFFSNVLQKSFAQATMVEKNKVSHRTNAILALLPILNNSLKD